MRRGWSGDAERAGLLPVPPAELTARRRADITRTLPVSGTFTALQREVYEIVLAAQQAALAQIGPGQPFRGYHRAIAQVLAAGLEQLGVLPVSAAESLRQDCGLHRRWTLCAPGHMLGLDVPAQPALCGEHRHLRTWIRDQGVKAAATCAVSSELRT